MEADKLNVEVFEGTDLSMLRYQRDYPKIIKNRQELSKAQKHLRTSPVTDFDVFLNDVIVYFKQNGEADSFIKDVIAGKVTYSSLALMQPSAAAASKRAVFFC